MCALYVNTSRERDGGAPAAEDTNIRDLVENCAHNDDITPLIRLMFEAQAVPESPTAIDADGKQMVSIIGSCLKAVASDQQRVISEVAHGNALGIATSVGEVEKLAAAVRQVRAALVGGTDAVQASGGALVAHATRLSTAADVQENLARAATALKAARGVLEECLAAGRLISQQRLYHALCSLDTIRRKHLGSLLSMLSTPPPGAPAAPGAAAPDAPRRTADTAAAGLSWADQARLSQLHAFFSALVDDLGGSARQLAVTDFNDWLVTVRTAARDIGMSAIRAAASERQLEEDLARERRAALAALAAAGAAAGDRSSGDRSSSASGAGAGGGCKEIGAALAASEFRRELESQRLEAEAAAGGGAGGGGERERDGGAGGGSQGPGLFEQLRAMSLSSKGGASAAAAAAVAAPARRPARPVKSEEEQQEERARPLPPEELDEIHFGEPQDAIAEVLRRHGIEPAGDGEGSPGAARARAAPKGPKGVSKASAGGGLLSLDLGGLYRAVHIHRCLGEVESFRAHYFEQRRLQLQTDTAPPSSFLESYQPYLASLVGFFTIESYLERASDGFLPPGQRAALWDGALRGLKAALEAALERMGGAEEMLMVKDFVVLVAAALGHAGYQVAPIMEVLTASCGRYHELLGRELLRSLGDIMSADSLENFEVRTPDQHVELTGDLGLPVMLEGAGPAGGRRPAAGAAQVLPYVAPYTSSIPALIGALRNFIADSASYLRGLYQPWELLPALFAARDKALSKALVDALAARTASAKGARGSMRCASNAWALGVALDSLDDWTAQEARGAEPGESRLRGGRAAAAAASAAAGARPATAAAAAAAGARARAKKLRAVVAGAGPASGLASALRGAQESAERAVLLALTSRVDELLDAGRKAPASDWLPAAPLPPGNSAWVAALVSSLQETFDAGLATLPRPAATNLMRSALRATAAALMRLLGPDGISGYTLYSIQRLAADIAALERFAARWGVQGLAGELAEPSQLCALLLSNKLEDVLNPELRAQSYGALDPAAAAAALDRYREVPGQAKKLPAWPAKKAADAVAKQLRGQVAAGAAGPRALEGV